jgi:hypothetical protein
MRISFNSSVVLYFASDKRKSGVMLGIPNKKEGLEPSLLRICRSICM